MKPGIIKFSVAFLTALLCGPLSGVLFAGAGKSGGEFLRIVQSPRAVGMGETGAGLYGDLLGALALNPAALARTGGSQAAFTYNAWLEGIATQQVAYAQNLGEENGVLAGSLSMLNMASIDGYNASGAYTGQVNARDLALGLSYARRLDGPWRDRRLGLFAGAGVKYARETLEKASASTALLDFGLLFLHSMGGDTVGAGVSLESVGSGFQFDAHRDPAPTVLRFGGSYILAAGDDVLSFALDAKKPNDTGFIFSAGSEYMIKRTVALRAGWLSDADLGSGIRFGGGVILKLMQFDYALAQYGKFGAAHRFSLTYKFGSPSRTIVHFTPAQERARWKTERAAEYIKLERYYEAVIELNDAIGLDPGNAEALELMRQTKALMDLKK